MAGEVARFYQTPPTLGNQFREDLLLREYCSRILPDDLRRSIEPEMDELGNLGGGELFRLQLEDLENEPKLTHWDAWGHRIDRIDLTPLWQRSKVITAQHGLVATGYENKFGPFNRVVQFMFNYLVQPSMDIYSCPLAMTDGATRTLLDLQNKALIDRAVPRLTQRDPAKAWTSGQWMTERTGGSDVSKSETIARKDGDVWRLYGTKWFTSATTSEMALTLARPEGNPDGSRGLAIFYLETRDANGRLNGIQINRLKDKLGTRKVPTAELTLDGAIAVPVQGLDDGVRKIASMLNVTRMWNSMGAIWGMRRSIALAVDYAKKRVAFGSVLAEKPLHVDTLASIAAEHEGAFLLAFRTAELFGRIEAAVASEEEVELLRALTPIVKLLTAKQAVAVASEAIECFGGAGYVEDTGLPRLLADAQVLPIWEGTTNVLSLDLLRVLAKPSAQAALLREIGGHLAAVKSSELAFAVTEVKRAMEKAQAFLLSAGQDRVRIEAGARQLALTIGRSYEAALCARHADWALSNGYGKRALAATRRLIAQGLDRIVDLDPTDAVALFG